MRPALDAPHMSLTILIASNSANNRPIRHDTHTTPARHARRHLATLRGDDGPGAYGTGFTLTVRRGAATRA